MLIRLADHDREDLEENQLKDYDARLKILDKTKFFNVAEAKTEMLVEPGSRYGFSIEGKARIKFEFEKKLKNGGFSKELIDKVKSVVDRVFRK